MLWARRLLRVHKRVALLLPLLLLAGVLILLNFSPDAAHLHRVHRQPYDQPPPSTPNARNLDLEQNEVRDDHEQPMEVEDNTISEEQRRPWFMRGGTRRPEHRQETLPLFPEDAPGSDRIVEQLMYTEPEEDERPIKKILIASGYGSWNVPLGREEFIRNKCPVDRCTISTNPKDAANADAILFKDHMQTRPYKYKRPPKQVWILYYLECPYHTPSLGPGAGAGVNWTATYRRDSDIVAPYERWVYHDPARVESTLERNYAANKTKKVAWFVSNCIARNKRLQYARQLSKYIPVDIYGGCGSLHCPRTDPNCMEMLDKDYKFYLAFENSNCKDYITEKFFVNGLGRDVLPIVMGAHPNEYADAAPHKSYIHVEEFSGPRELADYLHLLDTRDDLYNEYFQWKGTGEFINTFFFCRVCAMLHAAERRQRSRSYPDVQEWWRNSSVCTRGDWRRAEDRTQKESDPAY